MMGRSWSMSYNGYTNHATWAAALHIANDYDLYRRWNAEAQDCKEACDNDPDDTLLELADRLEAWLSGTVYETLGQLDGEPASLLRDLLADDEINWEEVSQEILDGLEEE
jgi:hypothetical protein